MAEYIDHLQKQLREIDTKIENAREKLEKSDLSEKAKALTEVNQLRHRHDDLVARIEEAKNSGSDKWSSFHASFQEDMDALRDTLDKWLTKLN